MSTVYNTETLTIKISLLLFESEVPCLTEGKDAWKVNFDDSDRPVISYSQRQLHEPLSRLVWNNLVNTLKNSAERVRLLAVGEWELGLRLQVLPSPNIGSILGNTTFQIDTCLRLGASCGVLQS